MRNFHGIAVTRRVGVLLAFVTFVGTPALASAQTQPPARDTLPRDSLAPAMLPPVLVTALRTPFEIGRVPFAVSVSTRDAIQEARAGLALDEALRGIPGVQVDNRYNYALGERISIRGFGARAQFGVRGVKVLVDGIPATMPDGQTTLNHVDLGVIGRAEVVRGPASAAYGNAAGGVILLETQPPPAGPLRQELRVVGGGDGLLRTQSTTAGIRGRGSYLLHLSRLEYDGYRDFNAAENVQATARLGFEGERHALGVVAHLVSYEAQNPGALSDSLLKVDRSRAFPFNVQQRTGETGEHGQIGVTWRRSTPRGELRVAAHALSRRLDNPIPPRIIDLERGAYGLRAAYGVSTMLGGRELQWLVGGETELQRDDRRNFVNSSGERGALVLDQLERVGSISGFTQLAAPLTEALSILAGLRYDRFRFEVDDHLITETNPDDSGERLMHALSPSFGVSYSLGASTSMYANVATSFETPTTTELANDSERAGGFNPDLEPQRAVSLEAGVKGGLGTRGSFQLAVYRARIRDALIPFEVPQVPGRQFFRNAGSTVHRGVEVGATVLLHPWLTTRAAYSYTDARFATYQTATESHDGNRVPGVAPHRLEAALTARGEGEWFVTLESRHVSAVPVTDANSAESPAHTVTDLRGGPGVLRMGGVVLQPFLGLTNLTDERYNTSVVINAAGNRFFEPGPGRTLYVGLDLAFGASR